MPTKDTSLHLWRRATFRYLCYGALFGALFPLAATLLDIAAQGLPLSARSVATVQSAQPLHWMIDTAPLFLGLFAALAGRRQDSLERAEEVGRLSAENTRLLEDMRRQLDELQRLQDAADVSAKTIRALSVPLIPVGHDMLALPLIGAFDPARMADLRTSLFGGVHGRRARIVIVDCTGLDDLAADTAHELGRLLAGLTLLGATPILCGVRAALARCLVEARVDLRAAQIAADLAAGIELGRALLAGSVAR